MTLKLGKLQLANPIIYAPLAGCSDYPFRKMAARYRPGLMFCEMVHVEAFLRDDEQSFERLQYSEEMRPIGAQLCGSDPKRVAEAAKRIERLGFDLIDLNCGCPVDRVTKTCCGSGLLPHPDKIESILKAIVDAVSIPVTVKIRAGWDATCINATKIVQKAKSAGAVMATIHGRTRAQQYRGTADRNVIKDAKESVKNLAIAGNGDIFDAASALHMFSHTQCDAICVSRGTLGRPWIAQDILNALDGLPPIERDIRTSLNGLLEHLILIGQSRTGKRAVVDTRKVVCWYCKHWPNMKALRQILSKVDSTIAAISLVEEHLTSINNF